MVFLKYKWQYARIRHFLISTIVIYGVIAPLCLSYGEHLSEYDLKAAFVYNFAMFTQWEQYDDLNANADLTDTIKLSVFGEQEVIDSFRKIDGKMVGKRKLVVDFSNDKEILKKSQIIFISKNFLGQTYNKLAIEQIFQAIKNRPVLTIGESYDFITLGGMVNFFNKNGRLYFEIHHERVLNSNIKLSSRLLNLAIIVGDK